MVNLQAGRVVRRFGIGREAGKRLVRFPEPGGDLGDRIEILRFHTRTPAMLAVVGQQLLQACEGCRRLVKSPCRIVGHRQVRQPVRMIRFRRIGPDLRHLVRLSRQHQQDRVVGLSANRFGHVVLPHLDRTPVVARFTSIHIGLGEDSAALVA